MVRTSPCAALYSAPEMPWYKQASTDELSMIETPKLNIFLRTHGCIAGNPGSGLVKKTKPATHIAIRKLPGRLISASWSGDGMHSLEVDIKLA